jgi:hypothetical protein
MNNKLLSTLNVVSGLKNELLRTVVFIYMFFIPFLNYSQHQCEFQNGAASGSLTEVCFHQFSSDIDDYVLMGCLMCQVTGNADKMWWINGCN